jgi:DNA-binding Lrp family transcriptional regulator
MPKNAKKSPTPAKSAAQPGRTLDPVDARILDVVQRDASLTHRAIGERVNLSASAVRRRLQAMTDDGVIRAIVALVDPEIANEELTVLVTVTFERETPDTYTHFQRNVAADPAIKQCYIVSGQFDAFLVVTAPSPEEFWKWAERVLTVDPAVRRYDSFVVWSTVKTAARPVLGEPPRRAKSLRR